MAWLRIESRYPRHPKVLRVSRAARYFNVEAKCYAGEYLTDGFIADAILGDIGPGVSRVMAQRYAEELVNAKLTPDGAGLWERVEGGYRIHDYLHYNPSAAEAREEEARRVAAGRAGGARSVAVRRAKYGSARPTSEAKPEAGASTSASRPPKDPPKQVLRRTSRTTLEAPSRKQTPKDARRSPSPSPYPEDSPEDPRIKTPPARAREPGEDGSARALGIGGPRGGEPVRAGDVLGGVLAGIQARTAERPA
jgi:hypothetical protein